MDCESLQHVRSEDLTELVLANGGEGAVEISVNQEVVFILSCLLRHMRRTGPFGIFTGLFDVLNAVKFYHRNEK